MLYQGGKRTKIIVASTAEEFEQKLNRELEKLDRSKTKYDLQFNHSLGFCAYIVSESRVLVPESVREEFELAGETHCCLECPHWVHPTDGRVKYTRCAITSGIHGAKSPCCDAFYEMLFKGEIELEGNDNA